MNSRTQYLIEEPDLPIFPWEYIYIYVRQMTMEARLCRLFCPNASKEQSAGEALVPPLWGKREKKRVSNNIVYAAAPCGICAFMLKVIDTLIKISSCDDRPSILTLNQPMANPLRVGQGQLSQITVSKTSGASVV